MTDKELIEWEHQPHVITVLTSREMGAWLGRRDSRILQEIRQEIEQSKHYKGKSGDSFIDAHDVGLDKYFDLGIKKALKIIDKHIKEYTE